MENYQLLEKQLTMEKKHVIGLDFGTDSVRAMIVNALTGKEIASGIAWYSRWARGLYCNAAENMFRQHPLDYTEGMISAVKQALDKSPEGTAEAVVGLSVDTTGSTPVAVDENCIPLSMLPGFEDNPHAMFVLWKDHTAIKEAEEINHFARTWGGVDYTMYEGGIYSSEWYWAKVLHVMRTDQKVRTAAYTFLEHCDWIPALLTSVQKIKDIRISRCAAGHKAMWHKDWGGLPSKEFLSLLDKDLAILRDRLYTETYTSDVKAGHLSAHWAQKLGLKEGIAVGVGAFDAHLGAVGGEIKPYYLSKVMGTSTCDMLVIPADEFGNKLVKGICGQVDGSIIPGMVGLEAGQSAFGDVYAWFRKMLMWPVEHIGGNITSIASEDVSKLRDELSDILLEKLSLEAEKIDPAASGLVATDWLNGRRTPDASAAVSGAIAGLTLGTSAPAIFRALIEATAFGSKSIVERFTEEGVRIDGVIALGGVAKKSWLVVQILADVLNMEIAVAKSDQTVALGAAMAASVVAGVHPDFKSAQLAMGQGIDKVFKPRKELVPIYEELYQKYKSMGEFFETRLIK